ncbi:MAG: hypothetical protein ACYC8T_33235 [Myxococcaceae bacterium]
MVEKHVENADRLRFFGLVGVPMQEMERAYEVLDAEPASFLVASSEDHRPVLDDRLVSVWQQHRQSDVTSWAGLASVICRNGGIMFRPFGFFDDLEVGTDVILESALLGRLLKVAT